MALDRYLVLQALKGRKIYGRIALPPLDILELSTLLVQVPNLILNCLEITRLNI